MREWTHRVRPDESGQRLDRFLQARLTRLSRSQIKRLADRGLIRVEGRTAKAGHLLRSGERIEVRIPPPPPITPEPEAIPINVLHEDAMLLVVDKPPGMTVHPGAGRSRGTLVNALLGRGTPLSPIGAPRRPGIVHRLDKGTSGVLVVAKTEACHLQLARALADREFERRYQALIWGDMNPKTGTISGSLARSRADRRRMRVVSRGGKVALTRYRQVWGGEGVSVLVLELETGRTHQIRAHLKHLGRPVFGDPEYGGRGGRAAGEAAGVRDRARRALALLPRQALHAGVLGFRHPGTGKRVVFASPLPEDILGAAAELEVPAGAWAESKEDR